MGVFWKKKHFVKPLLIALGAFLLLSLIAFQYTSFRKGLWEKDVRANLLEVLMGKKSSLEKALYSRIFYTRGVAAFVSLKPDISNEEFTKLASEYIKEDTVIATMSISRDGIINMVYPLEGHEEALGLNLLEHPERKAIVQKTIETHETFVAGPVVLMEGGIAFISYTPVFDKTIPGEDRFWGVTDIVIMRDALLREAGLRKSDEYYHYALAGYDGLGIDGKVFWGDTAVLGMDPVSISIDLPTGQWILSSSPKDGWAAYLDQDMTLQWVIIIGVLIISVLVYMLARSVTRLQIREQELLKSKASLAQMNDMKDKLFSVVAHDLRGPAGSLNGLITLMYDEPEKLEGTDSLELMKRMKLTADNLYRLLDNLLHWAKSQLEQTSVNFQPLKLGQVCDPVIAGVHLEAERKNVSLVNNLDYESSIRADITLTRIIIRNLLMNAIKYSHPGKEIILSSKILGSGQGKAQLEICVEDEGVGISPEKLRLFLEGNKLDSEEGTANEKGSGLGLILSREFALRMGGEIRIESVLGKGSKFCLILPVSA